MFVTTPQMEHRLPPGLTGDGGRYWQAFALGSDLPWFLLTVRRKEGRAQLVQTMAVAWESRLQELIEEAAPGEVTAVCRMSPCHDTRGRWCLEDVAEIWEVTRPAACDRHGPLLFVFRESQDLIDSYGAPVAVAAADRQLLVALNAQA